VLTYTMAGIGCTVLVLVFCVAILIESIGETTE
jgi:hypothetical protein